MRVFSLILAAVVSVLTLILLRYSGRISRETITWASSIVVCIIFALLVSPLVFNLGVFGTATVIVLIFTSLFLFGILLLKNPNFFVLLCCGFTALVIAVDLLLGSHLLRASPVGYSLAEGARFYGIGNEAMGIMLGAVFYFLSCALPIGSERKIQIMFSVLVLLSTFILIGSPAIGSNVGGALATVPAAVVFIVMVSGKRLSAKWIIPALAITMVAMLGTFAFDYLREAKEQSHAARLLELLYSGGASEVLQIIVRKLQVNLRLILTSLWSKLFAIAVVSTALLACHIKKLGQTLFNTRQEKAGVVGLIVAAVGALIFNDSGVVSAGMCSLYLWTFFALRVVPPDKYSLRDS